LAETGAGTLRWRLVTDCGGESANFTIVGELAKQEPGLFADAEVSKVLERILLTSDERALLTKEGCINRLGGLIA
jgi:hypothetical protein